MNKLFLLFTFVGLTSCKSDEWPTGVAAGASGRYTVWAYVVSGDTLFRLPNDGYYQSPIIKPGINKIGVSSFRIAIGQTTSDQVVVNTSYWRNGLQSTFSKEAVVNQTDYQYQFTPIKTYAPTVYEGRVGRFTKDFYERTAGKGALVILPYDSTPNQSSPQEVVVLARPER